MVERKEDVIRNFAYQMYKLRQRCGLKGTPEQDWADGEQAYESYKRAYKKEVS